jgi:hypothetical protein
MTHLLHHLLISSMWTHPLGQCAGTAQEVERCRSYNWYSGALADFSEITMVGIVVSVYKQHTCRAHWWCPCWAKHKVEGTTASVCGWHHRAKDHEKLQRRHARRHPNRLSHGQSTHPATGVVVDRLSNP